MFDYTYYFVFKQYDLDMPGYFRILDLRDIKNTDLIRLMDEDRLYEDDEALIAEISEKFDVEKEKIQILLT
ncbi:MAG: hypothetical protein J0G96_14315 [Flavobacteriia bacterium]|nr:hypothetical protein [Flavobacteriia bacterium]OJX37303.1 MAG: hypothetical protein BGO87_01275 [Flavobacteriia bacterium 40-80]